MKSTTVTLPEQDGLVVYEKKAIERVNPLREKLNELKELHKEFPTDLSTTKSQDLAKEQIRAFRELKGVTEKERKDVKGVINRLATAVDDSYNAVWDDAEAEQKWRDAKLKTFKEEKDRLEKEKKDAEEKLKFQRFATISKMGAMEIENHVVLGEYRIETRLIGSSTEEVWQNMILKGFTEQYEAIEAERQAEELRKQQEADELRQEQEELQRQKDEFNRKQAEFRRQQEEFETKRREVERLEKKRQDDEEQRKRWEEAEKKRQTEQARKDKIKGRLDQLDGDLNNTPMGWEYDGTIVINDEELYGFTDEDFNRIRDLHNKQVADNIAEAERIRREEEENQRLEAQRKEIYNYRIGLLLAVKYSELIPANIGEMSELEWESLYSEAKSKDDQRKHAEWLETERVKAIQEQERERERISDLSEGQRWRLWKDDLAKFTADMPQFSSKRYSKMKAIALEKFSEIQLLKAEKISSN